MLSLTFSLYARAEKEAEKEKLKVEKEAVRKEKEVRCCCDLRETEHIQSSSLQSASFVVT